MTTKNQIFLGARKDSGAWFFPCSAIRIVVPYGLIWKVCFFGEFILDKSHLDF